MAEIGAALREARTRARIEIAQMEAQTKIRAKYLRALENEEWELLPGPTYVKSFLKTYGDMLGLDGRQLVADYKRQQEPFHVEGDIGQISKHTGGRINRQQQERSAAWVRTAFLSALGVAALAAAAYFFVLKGDDAPTPPRASTPQTDIEDQLDVDDAPAARNVRVVVRSTGDVRVCVRNSGRVVVKERALRAGQKTAVASGRTVLVTVLSTSRALRLEVDGDEQRLPEAPAGALTVSVSSSGVKIASAATTACSV